MICIEFRQMFMHFHPYNVKYIYYIYTLHFNYGGCYEIYMGEKYARAKVAQKEEEEREKEEESRERERERY